MVRVETAAVETAVDSRGDLMEQQTQAAAAAAEPVKRVTLAAAMADQV
tara:strand:- start:352 stop:495 length:144 start_codon:yes stop_codon:yes gene_type:complete